MTKNRTSIATDPKVIGVVKLTEKVIKNCFFFFKYAHYVVVIDEKFVLIKRKK